MKAKTVLIKPFILIVIMSLLFSFDVKSFGNRQQSDTSGTLNGSPVSKNISVVNTRMFVVCSNAGN